MTQASGRRVVDAVLGHRCRRPRRSSAGARPSADGRDRLASATAGPEPVAARRRRSLVGAAVLARRAGAGGAGGAVRGARRRSGWCTGPTSAPGAAGRARPRVAVRGPGHPLAAATSTDADGVEHVTRVSAQAPYVALHPASGRVGGLVRDGVPVLEISPRRWGRRTLGEEKVALTSRWAGYRWGPVLERGAEMTGAAGLGAVRRARRGAAAARPGRRQPVAPGRATAPSSPASGRSTPATGCAGSTGGSRCAPATCTSSPRAARRTAGCCSSSTRWPTTGGRAASTAAPAAST